MSSIESASAGIPVSAMVTLASPDFEPLVAFYRQLLCRSPRSYAPQRYAEFALPGIVLAIFNPQVDQAEIFAGPAGGMSLCLEVKDLEAAIALLTQLGCAPPGPILNASHGREIYALDPAGNRLIIHQANPSD